MYGTQVKSLLSAFESLNLYFSELTVIKAWKDMHIVSEFYERNNYIYIVTVIIGLYCSSKAVLSSFSVLSALSSMHLLAPSSANKFCGIIFVSRTNASIDTVVYIHATSIATTL